VNLQSCRLHNICWEQRGIHSTWRRNAQFQPMEKICYTQIFMFTIRVWMIYNHWNRPFQPIKSLRLSAYSRKLPKKNGIKLVPWETLLKLESCHLERTKIESSGTWRCRELFAHPHQVFHSNPQQRLSYCCTSVIMTLWPTHTWIHDITTKYPKPAELTIWLVIQKV
jgi:hypothetical protein